MNEPSILLYDGTCRFCQIGSARLARLARPGSIERQDFHEPGVLDRFPQVTRASCESAMQLIMPTGVVRSGMGAAVEALATRVWLRWARWVYRAAPARRVLDWLYAVIARNRHRLMGHVKRVPCESGTCRVH